MGRWLLEAEPSTGPGFNGRLSFEWTAGGFYLLQRIDFDLLDGRTSGFEFIGYDAERECIRSYLFSNRGPGALGGIAPEYVWEIDGRHLTIWDGFVGSKATFDGTFSEDRRVLRGEWRWPGGCRSTTLRRQSVDGGRRL